MMRAISKLALMALVTGVAACGESVTTSPDAAMTVADGGVTPTCVQSPTNHQELINACTTAQHVEKNPALPLLNADGTLPPLP